MSLTKEQKRASFALNTVMQLKSQSYQGNYRSYVEALPAHIVMSGFGQSMATELAAARLGESGRNAKEEAHEKVYNDIQAWLREDGLCRRDADLMTAIVSYDQSRYQQAQAETLAYLIWFKKIAQAYLTKDNNGNVTPLPRPRHTPKL